MSRPQHQAATILAERDSAIAVLKRSGMKAAAIRRVIGGARVASDQPRAKPMPEASKFMDSITSYFVAELARQGWPVTLADMQGPRVMRSIAAPRMVAMAMARELSGGRIPFAEIGAYFGGRNHATVMHACDEGATTHLERYEALKIARDKTVQKFSKKSLPKKNGRG